MLIIPAIDMLDGKCVRLFKGDYEKVTVYSDDPAAMARSFVQAGAERIHLVDLDAARGGKTNRDVIARIRKAVDAVLELGGGIRTEEDVRELSDIGIDRLILGTVFAKDPELGAAWTEKFGQKFIAGIDALNGEVKVAGWQKGSGMKDTELAVKAAEAGMCSIIYTNITRDGTLSGPDTARTVLIAKSAGIPVTVSGGISCEQDFADITADPECAGRIGGIITGKGFYEKKFDLTQVIARYQRNEGLFF
ncbi:MAG: 1-(5-phosphoribosyl)-5-[(5-phosphoribosylamino)methylideneamino]imidazole-4-carboxamide isomerase [Spirochaetia bacterium]|nr:1-(5-phosphoribosyl)-5-[(5-phosphoribosylamino)methylideneamino]imidazole-4-carboxamide isomerase [Spirochaetia bacterium]